MQTHCTSPTLTFHPAGRRRVEAAFDAGRVTGDAGLLLLRETAQRSNLFGRVAVCFADHRAQWRVEHSVEELVAQRILGIACGYEDANDHDTVRDDPLLALAAGKTAPLGNDRRQGRDRGRPLAGHATFNRIQSAPEVLDPRRRDLKILHGPSAFEALFVDLFMDAHGEPSEPLILDLDATDDPVHGTQEGRFFHGCYGSYCYLLLYLFCGDFLLAATLRKADQEGAAGALEEVQRIGRQLRERWLNVRIVLRADSGFCRDGLMDWCEQTEGVDFVFGLARNKRLSGEIAPELRAMAAEVKETGTASRVYKELRYRTLNSWPRTRRVVAKAEALVGKTNPRFVVTSLRRDAIGTGALYGELYCARGDMENRIKEQQLGMFADRPSAHTMRANQLRLWFASLAYVLVNELRRIGLRSTAMAKAQVWTIRTRLLKIGGLFRQTTRRVRLSMSSAFVLQDVFVEALSRLRQGTTSLVF